MIVTFASYLLWFWLVRHYPATRLASFTLLTPVFGLLLDAITQPAAAGRHDRVATTLIARKSCSSPEFRMPARTPPEGKPRGRKKGEES